MTRPVNASAVGLSDHLDRQDMVAFWLAYSFAFDDTEPLPAMFRRKARADKTEPPSVNAEAKLPAAARLVRSQMSGMIGRLPKMTGIYILASLLLFFTAVDAALLTIVSFSPESAAVTWPASEYEGAQKTGAPFSPTSIEAAEDSGVPAIMRAENNQLISQLETWVNAGAEKSSGVIGTCAESSLNCWKTATFVR
jgi:hypothetical protein